MPSPAATHAVTLAMIFATVSVVHAAEPLGVEGVAEVRVVEREQSEHEESDSTSHSDTTDSNSTTVTCLIPWNGGCLFEFRETTITEHDESSADSSHERDLVNDGRNGVAADVGGGAVQANAGSGPERQDSESSSSAEEESFERYYYGHNFGFSEERIDESSSSSAASAAESRTVTSIGGGAAIVLPIAAATVGAGRERGEASSRQREETASATRDADWMFGIPLSDFRSASSSEGESNSTSAWNETVALVAVDAGDGSDVPAMNLATLEAQKRNRDETFEESSASEEDNSTRVFGYELIATDSSAEQFERTASSSETIGARGSVVGDAATAGAGYRSERTESDRSASGRDVTRIIGTEFGSAYDERSTSRTVVHEVSAGAATADGLAVVSASVFDREHETTSDRTEEDIVVGIPVGHRSRARDEGRSRGAVAAGQLAEIDATGGVSYDDTSSETQDNLLVNGTSYAETRSRERWHGVTAGGGSERLATGGSSRSGFSETEDSVLVAGTPIGTRAREAGSSTNLGAVGVATTSLDAGTRQTTVFAGDTSLAETRETWAESSGSITAPDGGPQVVGWRVGGRSVEVRDATGATVVESRNAGAALTVLDPTGGADHSTGVEAFVVEMPDGDAGGAIAVDPAGQNVVVPVAVPNEGTPFVRDAKAALAFVDPAVVFEIEAAIVSTRDDVEAAADPRDALVSASRADDETFAAVTPSAPLADPCGGDAPDRLCAPGPVGCVASALILRTGDDDDFATSAAPQGAGEEHDERVEEEPVPGARLLSSTCDVVTDAQVACGEAVATTVALDLTAFPVPIFIEADLVRGEACADALDPESDAQDARLSGLRLTVDGETISIGDSAPNTAFHLGPNILVSLNEQFERTIEACRFRHGAALRIRVADPGEGEDREAVLGWVSTVACTK